MRTSATPDGRALPRGAHSRAKHPAQVLQCPEFDSLLVRVSARERYPCLLDTCPNHSARAPSADVRLMPSGAGWHAQGGTGAARADSCVWRCGRRGLPMSRHARIARWKRAPCVCHPRPARALHDRDRSHTVEIDQAIDVPARAEGVRRVFERMLPAARTRASTRCGRPDIIGPVLLRKAFRERSAGRA